MKKLFVLYSLLFYSYVFAQTPEPTILWLKGYGGNSAVVPQVTSQQDGGFILCFGANTNAGNIDSLCAMSGDRGIFLKYNADGSILEWSKCSHDGSFLYPQIDGNCIFGGLTTSVPSGWAFKILKEDATGSIIWRKTYGGQAASAILRSMVATNDGGYFMFGETSFTDTDFTVHYGGTMYADFAIMKVDSNGNKVWSKVLGGTGTQLASTVIPAPSGGCYIVGTTTSNDYDCTGNHGGSDAYLARLDASGNLIWHRDLGGSGDDGGGGTFAYSNGKGGIIITTISGSNDGDVSHQINSGGYNIWALDIDSGNHILWNNCYGGGGQEFPNSVCKATDGSIWIAGYSNLKGGEVDTAYGNEDAWFVHADSIGNFLNAKVLGSHRQDEGTMVYPLSNGNVIAGGYYDTAGGTFYTQWYSGDDAFLVEFGPWIDNIDQPRTPNNHVIIYPNPAHAEITFSAPDKINSISIFNLLGQLLISKESKSENIKLNIADLPTGVYVVKTTGDDGRIAVSKFLKE